MLFNFLSSAHSQTYFHKLEFTSVSGEHITQIARKVTHFNLNEEQNCKFFFRI